MGENQVGYLGPCGKGSCQQRDLALSLIQELGGQMDIRAILRKQSYDSIICRIHKYLNRCSQETV